jgi:hypothetical protein
MWSNRLCGVGALKTQVGHAARKHVTPHNQGWSAGLYSASSHSRIETSDRHAARVAFVSPPFRLAVVVLYTAGLRRGELVQLVLSDYDSAERTLRWWS